MKKKKKPYVTYFVMAVCTVITCLIHFMPFGLSTTESAILYGAFYKAFVLAGEWWRLLTAGFVHADWMHLAVNMMSLYSLGRILEPALGKLRFTLLLLGSIILGNMFLLVLADNTIAVGISGGLYGLLGAYLFIMTLRGGWKIPMIRRSMLQVILINAVINFMPGIAYMAHIGGFFGGVLIYMMLGKGIPIKNIQRNAFIASLLLIFALGFKTDRSIPSDQIYMGSDYNILHVLNDTPLEKHSYRIAEQLDTLYDTGDLLQRILKGN